MYKLSGTTYDARPVANYSTEGLSTRGVCVGSVAYKVHVLYDLSTNDLV